MRFSLRDSCWLALLVVWLLHGPLSAVARGETRHVLVLSSSERPFAPQSGFADALMRELIRSSREPIRFVEVSVQAARASGGAPDLSIAQRIRSAFESQRLDLVVTIGGPAATFAQQSRQELFPATPMLIAGVDRRFVEHGTFTDNETTVATQHDPALMIDEILRLLPETRTVLVVVGASQVEQFWLQEMKREFRRFGDETDPRARAGLLDAGLARLTELWDGEFVPPPVQRPRIPIWLASRWPNRRPLVRAARWDGLFPVELPGPDELAELVAEVHALRDPQAGAFEIVVTNGADVDPAPWAAAGATWCLTGFSSTPSLDAVRAAIDAGP